MKTCRVCGCTDDEACVWTEYVDGHGDVEMRCSWVALDLCSGCVDVDQGDAGEPLLYDAYGAPVALRHG